MECKELVRSLKAGERINEAARSHISECGDCSQIAARESELSRLLREAQRVSVPASFDAVLQEKIESRKGRPERPDLLRPAFFIPVAAAVLVLVSIAALLALYPPPVPVELVGAPETGGKAIPSQTSEEVAEAPREIGTDPVKPINTTPVPETRSSPRNGRPARGSGSPGGGSLDLATSEAGRTTPPWLAPDVPVDSRPNLTERKFTPAEILKELGIEVRSTGGGLRVVTVSGGSIGARSGVRVGDVIKGLDGETLGTQPIRGGSISGKTLEIEREGKPITLPIRP